MLLVVTPGLMQALRRDRYVKRGLLGALVVDRGELSCGVRSRGFDWRAHRGVGGALATIRITSTTASGTHRDVLRSVFEFPDGRRGGARIYAMYRLDWKHPVGGVGKLAGDSGGGGGQ
jgi:hypothetical protein